MIGLKRPVGALVDLVSLVVVASLTAGCSSDPGTGDRPGAEVIRYDSAGVEIVEAGSEALERPLGWTVSDAPTLVFGTHPDDPRYQFLGIAGATELSDGRIAVADRRDQQVRIYSGSGVFELAFGGEGEGPGEFAFISGLERGSADTLVVIDRSQRRATTFDADGTLVRAVQFPVESLSDFMLRSDGGWFVGTRQYAASPGPGETSRDTMQYVTLDRDMSASGEIGWLPWWRRWAIDARSWCSRTAVSRGG